MNDRQKQSIDNVHEEKQTNGSYCAWNRTCATMDRLEDTLNYLNSIELGNGTNNRTAFDFYDFINNAYIVIDCIKTIGKIFRVDNALIEAIETSQSVFGNRLGDNCTDARYFEYIRSLCSVHPLCTNHQKEFLNGSKFHCCPFVTWDPTLTWYDGKSADLAAFIYPSEKGKGPIVHGLYVSQFEQYLIKWIDFIPKIIEAKNYYTDVVYDKLRKEQVKYLSDFKNDVPEYLTYLKAEYCKRFDYGSEYLFDECRSFFTITLSDPRNRLFLEKYQNAILLSLTFLRNELQNMSYEGYDNNGIKYPEAWLETTLFDELSHISPYDGSFSQYSNIFEKMYYLSADEYYSEYDKMYARRLLEDPKDLINHYIYFTNTEPDKERVVLVRLALYLDALTQKCLLNKNIPNDLEYRLQVLSDDQFNELFKEKVYGKPTISLEDFLKQIEEYGG